jgi:methionyl-tRNA formyltransferase
MLRIAFAGTPEFAVPTLRALAGSGHVLVGVLTQPDRPAGRGRELNRSPVKQLALELGLPLSQPARLREEAERAPLESWSPELLVVAAYGLILPTAVLTLPRLGCINVHASLLPRWRGAAPIQRAILAGDAVTGVTIMQMEAGLDTGPMLAQQPLAIESVMTSGQLQNRLASLGADLLMRTLGSLEAGSLEAVPQPSLGVTYATKIVKAEALIDWRDSAANIERKVRAFDPWPVAETRWQGQQLRVWEARAITDQGDGAATAVAPPGEVVPGNRGQLLVRCGSGVLGIGRLQLSGRRVLSAEEFLRGQPTVGMRFE